MVERIPLQEHCDPGERIIAIQDVVEVGVGFSADIRKLPANCPGGLVIDNWLHALPAVQPGKILTIVSHNQFHVLMHAVPTSA